MEVNKHINFLRRRGFLLEQELELDLGLDDSLNFDYMCGRNYPIFCKLSKYVTDNEIEQQPKLYEDLVLSITNIWKYLKPKKRVHYRGTSKFSTLITSVLSKNPSDAINTFKILSEKIDDVDVSKLHRSLNRTNHNNFGGDDIIKLIDNIKHKSYTEYENSFIGDHFEPASGARKLELSHRDDIIYNQKFTSVLHKELLSGGDYRVLAKGLYHNIINNFNNDVGKYIKADLRCVKSLFDENGNTIIDHGDYVEVKKMDYNLDSYLSEFFSIHKNPKDLPKELKTDEGISLYNNTIDVLYRMIRGNDGGILDTIRDNFAGIIFENNRFIPKDNITLYWSNKGQRKMDHRLSIRFKLNSNNVDTYIYSKDYDILVKDTVGDVKLSM